MGKLEVIEGHVKELSREELAQWGEWLPDPTPSFAPDWATKMSL